MELTFRATKFKTLKPGDPGFMLNDGIVVCPRAGVEIAKTCPREYRQIIAQAIEYGYIKPVAHLYDYELEWDLLAV